MTTHDVSVHGVLRVLRIQWLSVGSLAIATLAGAARAQIAPGDILVNYLGAFPHTPHITRFHPDGTRVWSTSGGLGQIWEGCAITLEGHVVTTRRYPSSGIEVLDSNGERIASFDTPQVGGPADLGVFADGTLAINDQSGGIDLYTQAGAYVSTFPTASPTVPFGSFVDPSDHLWVTDVVQRQILEFDRAGVLLATIALTFPPGDLVVAPDGTLWVTSRVDARLVHLSADGTHLASLPTIVVGSFVGIALARDDSFFLTGDGSINLYRYSSAGTLLATVSIGQGGPPAFLTAAQCGADPDAYCAAKTNSLGCVPAISSLGVPSASTADGFLVRGANVRNNKDGLLFYGTTGREALPFQGGTLCVKVPLKRTDVVNSGGAPAPANDCSGVFEIDLNRFAHQVGSPSPLPALTVPGTIVNCQWWGRDQGFPAPNNTTLTDALEYVVCP